VNQPLLRVDHLGVRFASGDSEALRGASYEVDTGQTLGIIGEPATGKTVLALTTLGLTRAEVTGRISFDGRDLVELAEPELRRLRGNDLALVLPQGLHPCYKIGWQVAEVILAHRQVSKSAARDRTIGLLELVGIPEPHIRVDHYPRELSDSQRCRALIAIAIANEPKLLIADEPGRGLDDAARRQILELLRDLRQRLGAAMVILSRDLPAVAEIADQVSVLRAGRIYSSSST
jgi:peptide/nickel transport system ATP-binding protein